MDIPAEAKRNVERVVEKGDEIGGSPETKGCGAGYRSPYKPYCSKFPRKELN